MKEIKKAEFDCSGCVKDCRIRAEFFLDGSEGKKVLSIRGNGCIRGEAWVQRVIEHPFKS